MEYTKRRNLNRGYMKLEVWNEGQDLFKFVYNTINIISKIDLKLKSQILDAAQSVPSNIAEGYCRRSINEYIQYLYISLGSLGEMLTRIIGLTTVNLITKEIFEEIDKLHYSVENKLLSLVKSLELKRDQHSWDDRLHEPGYEYDKDTGSKNGVME